MGFLSFNTYLLFVKQQMVVFKNFHVIDNRYYTVHQIITPY